jgi:peptide/nickel transport system permease protein
MRSSVIDTLGQDYIRTARAKGLSRGQAVIGHALRNALIPVMTIIGLQFSFLLAGRSSSRTCSSCRASGG